MNNPITTPVIESVKLQEASLTIRAHVTLANLKTEISGQYNIHSNCFYPSVVDCEELSVYQEDLESFCERMDWEYTETYELVQEAVENRSN